MQCRGRGGAGWREGWGEVLTWAVEVTSRSRLSSEDELALDWTHLLSRRRSLDWVGDCEGDSRATRWYSPASSIKKAGEGPSCALWSPGLLTSSREPPPPPPPAAHPTSPPPSFPSSTPVRAPINTFTSYRFLLALQGARNTSFLCFLTTGHSSSAEGVNKGCK